MRKIGSSSCSPSEPVEPETRTRPNEALTVPDLVHRELLWTREFAVLDRVFFQEIADLVARVKEVVVPDVVVVAGGEAGLGVCVSDVRMEGLKGTAREEGKWQGTMNRCRGTEAETSQER